jgi:hypothetical protein
VEVLKGRTGTEKEGDVSLEEREESEQGNKRELTEYSSREY